MNVLVFSIGRLDWNIWKPILQVLKKRKINYNLVISSLHLSKKYGSSYKQIIKDGYKIFKKIKINFKSSNAKNISQQFSNYSKAFSDILSNRKYDFIFLVGDRIESLALASTSIPFKIPIVHFHGGEISEGSYDDLNRHAISKISHMHCVANEIFKKRLIQMGEEKWRISVVDAPGIDFLKKSKKLSLSTLCKRFKLEKNKEIIIFNFNSESLNPKIFNKGMSNIMKVLEKLKDYNVIITGTNYDLYSDFLNRKLKKSAKKFKHLKFIKSLGNDYPSLLNYSKILIGNSSSGIIESCTFKIPTINIGNRQNGRLQSKNIINTNYLKKNILSAIKKAESKSFNDKLKTIKNLYGEGHFQRKFTNFLLKLKKLNKQQLINKKFIDLN